jgi:TadE-like protein
VSKRLRSHSGQATIEFAGTAVILFLVAMVAWQAGMVGWTWASAANAARTAARLYSRTTDTTSASQDGKKSLNLLLRNNARVWFEGDVAHVRVDIPILVPLLPSGLHFEETAEMPPTG